MRTGAKPISRRLGKFAAKQMQMLFSHQQVTDLCFICGSTFCWTLELSTSNGNNKHCKKYLMESSFVIYISLKPFAPTTAMNMLRSTSANWVGPVIYPTPPCPDCACVALCCGMLFVCMYVPAC